jgi:hypothetical protein
MVKNGQKSIMQKILIFLTQKTHRRAHGNKTAFFQKKRIFTMLKSPFLTQKTHFT